MVSGEAINISVAASEIDSAVHHTGGGDNIYTRVEIPDLIPAFCGKTVEPSIPAAEQDTFIHDARGGPDPRVCPISPDPVAI